MKYKYLSLKLTCAQCRLLGEAWRRLRVGSQPKDVTYNMLGLGFPSEYRPVVDAGLMAPSFRAETPRIMGWYKLTEVGRAIIRQMVRKHGYKSCYDTPEVDSIVKVRVSA